MKKTQRLAELAVRLRINTDFQELWKLVTEERDRLVRDAIHGTDGDPAEKRGAARAFDQLVTTVEEAPNYIKKLQQ